MSFTQPLYVPISKLFHMPVCHSLKRFPHFFIFVPSFYYFFSFHSISFLLFAGSLFKGNDAASEESMQVDIITDRVRSTRREVMFSVCPHLEGGTPDRSRWEGVPHPALGNGGTSARSNGGGYPSQVWWPSRDGVPPPHARSGWIPHLGWGTPLAGVPPPRYRTTDGVLDTPRSVCLLRSRRRTFLLQVGSPLTAENNVHSQG